jgi:dTMP kinase
MADVQFVALEGPKGAGKTTLCAALAARLSPRMHTRLVLTKEPTPAFDLRSEQALRGIDLARAIAADRRAHVAGVIGPALAGGRPVLCDRYILSSYVFHVGDGVAPSAITALNRPFPLPSLNLILHVRDTVLRSRRARRGQVTRLQSADTAGELAQYLGYARLMESWGSLYEVCDNSNQDEQRAIIDRLLRLLFPEDWKVS